MYGEKNLSSPNQEYKMSSELKFLSPVNLS